MKYIKLFEIYSQEIDIENSQIDNKIAEFYKTYFNLHWLCGYFTNVDKFPQSKPSIFKKHKKAPMVGDYRLDNDTLYFRGFPIPLAKDEDNFSSLSISVFNTLKHDDEFKPEEVLGENSTYDNSFNGIWGKVSKLDLAVNELFDKISNTFYKDSGESQLKQDELLKETTVETKNYFNRLMRFEYEQDQKLGNLIFNTFFKERPKFLDKIWNLWDR